MLKNLRVRLYDRRQQWSQLRLRHKIIVVTVALLVVGAGSAAAYFALSLNSEPAIEIAKIVKTTVPSPLTGVEVKPELAGRPVTGVMVENSLDARPQSGLSDAGIVFEAIAEGGITRFLALYQEGRPQYVGPVRSLRPYYIDWASAFDASIAHVGGSPDALKQIRRGGKDLDQFFNAGSYWRVGSRAAPHNLYTSFKNLDALNKSKGYKKSKFTPWARKSDSKREVPKAATINIAVSSALYNVHYDYSGQTNSYTRSEGGQKHLTTKTEHDSHPKRLHPKVVMVLVMSYVIASDGHHSVYKVNGNGSMYVFQDGGVIKGTWSKKSRSSQFVFKDSTGEPIKLNAGQTWVTVIGDKGSVSYTAPKPTSKPQ